MNNLDEEPGSEELVESLEEIKTWLVDLPHTAVSVASLTGISDVCYKAQMAVNRITSNIETDNWLNSALRTLLETASEVGMTQIR